MNDPLWRFVARENAVPVVIGMLIGSAVLAIFTNPQELGYVGTGVALLTVAAATLVVVDVWRTRQLRAAGVSDTAGVPARRRAIQLGIATFIALAGAIFLGWLILQGRVGQLYVADIGDLKSVNLPDGSTVKLNTGTLMRVRFEKTLRRVRLERGEALFTVAHDEGRMPFEVDTSMATVRAVGTAFSVRLRDAETIQVLVQDGSVRVRPIGPSKAGAAIVHANELVEIRTSGSTLETLTEADTERRLAWTTGVIIFEDEPLIDVIREINRYTEKRLIVEDAGIAETRVGGRIEIANMRKFLAALEKNYHVRVEHLPSGDIRLTRAEAGD